MRKYKYTKETLDVALEELQSENVVQRKKCINFISMASRSELFGKTCDTLSVQTWFLSSENREKLIRVLHQETEEKLLWEYLLILLMVCERYIDHGCYAKDFAKESSCVEFKQRAYEIAKTICTSFKCDSPPNVRFYNWIYGGIMMYGTYSVM